MLRSMTGFGQGKIENCKVEVRALNRRFCEVNVKLPSFLFFFEEEIKKIVKRKIKRGRIDVLVNLSEEISADSINCNEIEIDKDMVLNYKKAGEKLAGMLKKNDELKLDFFMSLPGILKIKKKKINTKKLLNNIKIALYQSLKKLEQMRKKEGKVISNDFDKRTKKINSCFSKIKLQLPKALKKYENKLLMSKLYDFLKKPQKNDEKKFQINSIIAERMEITEEIVRFKSHLGNFRKTFKGENEVGKKLDFIIQEMNREINTIGAKINNYKISHEVIKIKNELEKLKEQVQNIV
ncbi:YicC family protein [bacterium]|nr:YicC family protein [bacterium]